MKKLGAILLVVLTSSTVFAIMPKGRMSMEDKVKVVEKLASKQIGKEATDLRIGKAMVIPNGICGGVGPSIIVDLEVRKLAKVAIDESTTQLEEQWRVIKSYGVRASEVGAGYTPELLDEEACQ